MFLHMLVSIYPILSHICIPHVFSSIPFFIPHHLIFCSYPFLAIYQPIGSMYDIYANIGGILMVNVTIYSIHGSYGQWYSYPIISPVSLRFASPASPASPRQRPESKDATCTLCKNGCQCSLDSYVCTYIHNIYIYIHTIYTLYIHYIYTIYIYIFIYLLLISAYICVYSYFVVYSWESIPYIHNNVSLWLEGWYPIVRNFLQLIQYHAVCGGSLYCEIFFQIIFSNFIFCPNVLLLILFIYVFIIFIFILSIFILILISFSLFLFLFFSISI